MRDYKKEYREYQGKPAQIKRRAKRNAARAKMEKLGHVRKGDGKDVHHRNNNPHHNGTENLAATSRSKNRGYPRDANNKPKKGLSKLAARVERLIEFSYEPSDDAKSAVKEVAKYNKWIEKQKDWQKADATDEGQERYSKANESMGRLQDRASKGFLPFGKKARARRAANKDIDWVNEQMRSLASRIENLIEFSFVTKVARTKRDQVKRILNKISIKGGGDGSEFTRASVVNIKGKKGPHLILHRGTPTKEGQFMGIVNRGGVHTSTDKRIARAFGANLVGSGALPDKVKLTGHLSSIAVPAAPLLKRLKKGATTRRGTRIDPDGAWAQQQDIILNRRLAKPALIRNAPVFGNRELPSDTIYKAAIW